MKKGEIPSQPHKNYLTFNAVTESLRRNILQPGQESNLLRLTTPDSIQGEQVTCLPNALISAFQSLGVQIPEDDITRIRKERIEIIHAAKVSKKFQNDPQEAVQFDLNYSRALAGRYGLQVQPVLIEHRGMLEDLIRVQGKEIICKILKEAENHAIHAKSISVLPKIVTTNESEYTLGSILYDMTLRESEGINAFIVSRISDDPIINNNNSY